MRKGVSPRVFNRGGIREQYMTLSHKRPLLPADIYQLEKLMLLMMHQQLQQMLKAKNVS